MESMGPRFPREVRLLNSRDFQAVFRETHCRSSDGKLMALARRNSRQTARLGLAISKRAIKTAVARNRIKRIIRESFRHHQQQLRGLDIVMMCQKEAMTCTNSELRSSLQMHWRRVAERCAES